MPDRPHIPLSGAGAVAALSSEATVDHTPFEGVQSTRGTSNTFNLLIYFLAHGHMYNFHAGLFLSSKMRREFLTFEFFIDIILE